MLHEGRTGRIGIGRGDPFPHSAVIPDPGRPQEGYQKQDLGGWTSFSGLPGPSVSSSHAVSTNPNTPSREESERVSELKNVTGSSKLPYGTLVLGAEGIKDAITNFEDARKSDIENERLPPDLVDPEAFYNSSFPTTPVEDTNGMMMFSDSSISSRSMSVSPVSPGTPVSPGGFKPSHSRRASWGTTMTSPSTRRRSIDTTMNLIKEAVDGKQGDSEQLEELAEQLSSPLRGRGASAA